jgi:hypothetical protein
MLIAMPVPSSRVVNAALVNCAPRSVLKISGSPKRQRHLQSLDTEQGVHRVGEPPGEHRARKPVDDRDQIQKAAADRDIGDVGRGSSTFTVDNAVHNRCELSPRLSHYYHLVTMRIKYAERSTIRKSLHIFSPSALVHPLCSLLCRSYRRCAGEAKFYCAQFSDVTKPERGVGRSTIEAELEGSQPVRRQAVGAARAFDPGVGMDAEHVGEREVERLHAKIGQLTVERDFLASCSLRGGDYQAKCVPSAPLNYRSLH